jgi:hypothetical protein
MSTAAKIFIKRTKQILDASSSSVSLGSTNLPNVYIPGKLGIGTSTINNALDVSGTVNILGNINLNNQNISTYLINKYVLTGECYYNLTKQCSYCLSLPVGVTINPSNISAYIYTISAINNVYLYFALAKSNGITFDNLGAIPYSSFPSCGEISFTNLNSYYSYEGTLTNSKTFTTTADNNVLVFTFSLSNTSNNWDYSKNNPIAYKTIVITA